MQPAHALFSEDVVPIEVAGFKLRGSGIASVGNADCAANAEAALGKIQAIAPGAADAIVGAPFDESGIDSTLENKVFD